MPRTTPLKVRVPLKDLKIGHIVKENAGRRRWFKLVYVGEVRDTPTGRQATGEWLYGKRKGQRDTFVLYDLEWEVQQSSVEQTTAVPVPEYAQFPDGLVQWENPRWIVYHEVESDGFTEVFATYIATAAELPARLDHLGVPVSERTTREWSHDNHRISWAETSHPSLSVQRNAFLTELRALIEASDWHAVLDAVAERGASLGRSDRWAAACEWFAAKDSDGRPVERIAFHGTVRLAQANKESDPQ